MKRNIVCLFLLILFCNIHSQVNGDLQIIDGKKVLTIWGSHQERGYAHGYIMGNEIRAIAVDYFIGGFLFNNLETYNYCRTYFEDNFTIENKYLIECQAMVDGMTDSGTDMFVDQLDKNIEAVDILMANSIVDLYNLYFINFQGVFGCSSLSAWGESTADDPVLEGNLVITRNMDWSASDILIDNHLLIVNIPTEENEISWVSFSFAGLIGVLSGINSNGTAAFMNVGNFNTTSNTENLHPIFFSIRNGIEHYDYNSDGQQNELDVVSSVSDKTHLTGSIIHSVYDPDAVIIETNNYMGTTTRRSSDNVVIPEHNLVATNHFRALYNPINCYRYNKFEDSLNVSIEQNIFRNWDITIGAGGVNSNLHTIQYVPSTGHIKWSAATEYDPAYMLTPTEFDLVELLNGGTSTGDQTIDKPSRILTYQNPFVGGTRFSFSLEASLSADLTIYNIKGQKVKKLIDGKFSAGDHSTTWDGRDDNGRQVVSGLYFYTFSSSRFKETGRLIIIK